MATCIECGAPFQSDNDWMRKCHDCFKEGRKSVSYEQSKHPALVYEREHPFETPGYTENAKHVLRCLVEAKAMLPEIKPQEREVVVIGARLREIEACEHEFDRSSMSTCRRCGVHQHEWLRYIAELQSDVATVGRDDGLPPVEEYL